MTRHVQHDALVRLSMRSRLSVGVHVLAVRPLRRLHWTALSCCSLQRAVRSSCERAALEALADIVREWIGAIVRLVPFLALRLETVVGGVRLGVGRARF